MLKTTIDYRAHEFRFQQEIFETGSVNTGIGSSTKEGSGKIKQGMGSKKAAEVVRMLVVSGWCGWCGTCGNIMCGNIMWVGDVFFIMGGNGGTTFLELPSQWREEETMWQEIGCYALFDFFAVAFFVCCFVIFFVIDEVLFFVCHFCDRLWCFFGCEAKEFGRPQ